jgi:rare lipoprotein A
LFLGSFNLYAQNIEGAASFYAKKFNGRKTACGEIFCNDSLTAAHKTLPFGSIVKVTNLKNDSTVRVRINDRLPANSKRTIDLSQAAAKKLNFINSGITRVSIAVLNKEESPELNSP